MESFIIEGGQPLKGSITPQGAKNEALQILCAVLLTPEVVDIHNIPDIVDVNKLIKLPTVSCSLQVVPYFRLYAILHALRPLPTPVDTGLFWVGRFHDYKSQLASLNACLII